MTENNHHLNPASSNSDHHSDESAPQFFSSRPGRLVSFSGLVERIVGQFHDEHGEGASDAMADAKSITERRGLVRDVADYIFGVESVQLELKEQARIIARAYSEIFGYGSLDNLLEDDAITTISLEGARKVAVRRGPGAELESLEPLFEGLPQMRRMVERLLRHAGAQLRDDISIIEAGLVVNRRRLSINVVAPPLVPELTVDIRLHPAQQPQLADYVQQGIMDEKAAMLLKAIAQSSYGFVIVGDTESGKTTLLASLLHLLDEGESSVAVVERAGEMTLPETVQRFVVQWPVDDEMGVTFGQQIEAALEASPDVLVLDEVRADEPALIEPLLSHEDAPRLIWSFRGASNSMRVRSALSMIARMANRGQSEAMVYQLYERLPFVVMLKRRKDHLELREIAEWQFPDETPEDEFAYADYVTLMEKGWDGLVKTGKHPKRLLQLPDDFWQVD